MKIRPKKSLGQHFLNSKKVLDEIIATANIERDECVLEVGPGTGVLTRALLNAGARVIAVEKDGRALQLLKEKFAAEYSDGRLTLIENDILKFDCKTAGLVNRDYALVANIPYYITGAILEKFLENEPRPNRMILLVQKEVADRIVTNQSSGNKESILSISVKAFGDPRVIAKVSRGAFTPPPTVDSAILLIAEISDSRFTEHGLEIRGFFDIVRAGFAHKRKLLLRNLETIESADKLKTLWVNLNLNENIRAEELRLEQWIEITKNLVL